jgi:transposase, IS30 family
MGQYTQLKELERVRVYEGLKQGLSLTMIAESIGRDKSTVSREVRRNGDPIGYLYPRDAQKRTEDRKARHGSKVERNVGLKAYVLDGLKRGLSPEIIAGLWKQAHPDQSICTEAIYQFIYAPRHRKLELWKLLNKRKKKRGLVRKSSPKETIQHRVSIHERPEEINTRQEFGHYEGDLFFNKGSMSANVLVMIERVSRRVILVKQDSKQSRPTRDALEDRLVSHAKSCTFDNGTEFAEHYTLSIPTYFCDPYSPWQKGSVENVIKLIRERVSFNTEPDSITQQLLDYVADQLNNRPRKILGFKTPNEVFEMKWKKEGESRVKPALPAVEVSFNLNLESVALHA